MRKLNLTDEEFATLGLLLRRIGGSPYDSPRKHVASIVDKMVEDDLMVKVSEYDDIECLDAEYDRVDFFDSTVVARILDEPPEFIEVDGVKYKRVN